jgi:hypothetical protein
MSSFSELKVDDNCGKVFWCLNSFLNFWQSYNSPFFHFPADPVDHMVLSDISPRTIISILRPFQHHPRRYVTRGNMTRDNVFSGRCIFGEICFRGDVYSRKNIKSYVWSLLDSSSSRTI